MVHRFARIYLAPDRAAIVAAGEDAGGICYEEPDPAALPDWQDPVILAGALRDALRSFKRVRRDLRIAKKTDWPAYRLSGARSVDSFEKEYLLITVSALNEAELFYEATVEPPGETEITLRVLLNPYGTDVLLGERLLRLHAAALAWYDALGHNLN